MYQETMEASNDEYEYDRGIFELSSELLEKRKKIFRRARFLLKNHKVVGWDGSSFHLRT